MKEYLVYDIVDFINDDKISNILISNNILKVGELWNLKRKDLKEFGLNDNQINKIIIKLQLLGIDLNKKICK